VLETASPPTFYVRPADVNWTFLVPAGGESFCEWKGIARYWALAGSPSTVVGWSYPSPSHEFDELAGWLAFYPGRVACFVAGERVVPQPGSFYGGWITADVVGPFKGEPGTSQW